MGQKGSVCHNSVYRGNSHGILKVTTYPIRETHFSCGSGYNLNLVSRGLWSFSLFVSKQKSRLLSFVKIGSTGRNLQKVDILLVCVRSPCRVVRTYSLVLSLSCLMERTLIVYKIGHRSSNDCFVQNRESGNWDQKYKTKYPPGFLESLKL